MQRIITLLGLALFSAALFAQNLESLNGKDIKQPGELNPALAGLQEDLVRVLTDADVGNSFQLMLEGRMPLKLGNYMVGYERIYNEYAQNNMLNVTYGRTVKTEKKYSFRYGGSLQFNQRSLFNEDFDSTNGYTFRDLNGELVTVPSLNDLNRSIDYVDFQFGFSFNFDKLIASVSVENMIKQNISFDRTSTRTMPLSANAFVGGFLKFGDNYTLFPSFTGAYSGNEYFVETAIDFNTPYFNIGGSYVSYDQFEAITGNIAVNVKKLFVGLEYSHPIEVPTGFDQYPRFNLFLNTSVFKSRNFNKSDFAELIKKFY
ncbi:type IX secretion system membrane protein PorP/SprF [bacterium]|nr:type IX secretion system membrane protein PorP/SprF [bacterium]